MLDLLLYPMGVSFTEKLYAGMILVTLLILNRKITKWALEFYVSIFILVDI